MENNTWQIRNKTYLKEENEDGALSLEVSETFIENENKVETILCGFCETRIPRDDWNKHWDKCEARLSHPLYQKVKPTIKIKTNEEETPEAFLARIGDWEKPEPAIPWLTRIGRKPK